MVVKKFGRMGRAKRNPSGVNIINNLMGFASLYPSYSRTFLSFNGSVATGEVSCCSEDDYYTNNNKPDELNHRFWFKQ
jgi:hypothetical protein